MPSGRRRHYSRHPRGPPTALRPAGYPGRKKTVVLVPEWWDNRRRASCCKIRNAEARLMKRSYLWYVLVALLALAPLGIRVLTRPAPRQHNEDASMAQAGQKLFVHDWTSKDPLSPNGDGLGPV